MNTIPRPAATEPDSAETLVWRLRCRQMEEALRLDVPPVLIARSALLLVEARHGRSHLRTILWLAAHYLEDAIERSWLELRLFWWRAIGKDPYEELMRIAGGDAKEAA